MTNANFSPRPLGVGCPLYALGCALIGYNSSLRRLSILILFYPVIALITLICPMLLPLYLKSQIKEPQGPVKEGGTGLSAWFMILGEAVYLAAGFGIMETASGYIDEAAAQYAQKASEHKVLQIATPEQLEFASSITWYASAAALIIVILMLILMALTLGRSIDRSQGARLARQAVLYNLPGFMLNLALGWAGFLMIERFFAHFKMVAVEAMLTGADYFNPALPFLLLRSYAASVLFITLCLMLMMSLGMIKTAYVKLSSDPQDPR